MATPEDRALAQLGLRPTPQRLMIVEALHSRDDHFCAEDIWTQVRADYPQINLSTIYRTLELLAGQGLVTATELGDGRVRYHWVEKSHHHHLVCEQCGAVIELGEQRLAELRDSLLRDCGFEASFNHLIIFGRCAGCRTALKRSPGPQPGEGKPEDQEVAE